MSVVLFLFWKCAWWILLLLPFGDPLHSFGCNYFSVANLECVCCLNVRFLISTADSDRLQSIGGGMTWWRWCWLSFHWPLMYVVLFLFWKFACWILLLLPFGDRLQSFGCNYFSVANLECVCCLNVRFLISTADSDRLQSICGGMTWWRWCWL